MKPHVISRNELPASEAKWITLEKIKYKDQDGRERFWEVASRKTRKESGIDAVAILTILQPKDKSPPAIVILEQYRPPVDQYVIELPADGGETPEQAAIRELKEETGFEAEGIIESSYLMVTSPGMSTANMKLVALRVPIENENALKDLPEQVLEPGEYIVRKGFAIDARLSHFALGYHFSTQLGRGDVL
ncbi:hypothetical protein Clacol_009156 [Clathrus columnatus]|uniref:Nudix hydrolase domain-containing protein n=1 Tax=Clathrus columnatus TaxID=1419009 RepID=A0AAV5AM84_9AGAM|nr:hypothetical protein Clacol_009156 [Clathrus columnatus]